MTRFLLNAVAFMAMAAVVSCALALLGGVVGVALGLLVSKLLSNLMNIVFVRLCC